MTVSYKKLWKLLIDKNLKKKDLIQMSGISNYTLNKLNAGKSVTTDTLVKICKALDCQPGDLLKYVPDDEDKGEDDEKEQMADVPIGQKA